MPNRRKNLFQWEIWLQLPVEMTNCHFLHEFCVIHCFEICLAFLVASQVFHYNSLSCIPINFIFFFFSFFLLDGKSKNILTTQKTMGTTKSIEEIQIWVPEGKQGQKQGKKQT